MNVNTREIGLVGQRHQIEHDRGVLFPRVGDPHRRDRNRDLGRRLLLGPLNARFDLADVLQVLIQTHTIARAETAFELCDIAGHRIENAAVLPHARDAFGRRSRPAEHALEDHARVGLHRHWGRRRLPRNGVHVGAAVAHIAGADVAGEVLGADLERREHAVGADLRGDDLVERGAGNEVLGFGALGRAAREPRAGAHGVRAGEGPIHVRHHDHLIAERFDRLENGAELETDTRCRRHPVAGPLPHRHEDRAEAPRRRRCRADHRRHRRHHRVEQRQRQRCTHAAKHGPSGKRRLGDEHHKLRDWPSPAGAFTLI
jgi:hypothetical protein